MSPVRVKVRLHILAILWIALCAECCAGTFTTIPADVRVTFTGAPLDHVVPGELIAASITVTNLGPGVVQSLEIESSEYLNEWQLRSIDCNHFFPEVLDGTNGFSYKYLWIAVGINGQVSKLDVGQSLTCNMTFSLTAAAPPRYAITFGLAEIYTDIDQSNDAGTVTIQQQVSEVPGATSRSLCILALLLSIVALVRMRVRV